MEPSGSDRFRVRLQIQFLPKGACEFDEHPTTRLQRVNAPVLNFFFCFSFPLLSFRLRFRPWCLRFEVSSLRDVSRILNFHLQIATVSFFVTAPLIAVECGETTLEKKKASHREVDIWIDS